MQDGSVCRYTENSLGMIGVVRSVILISLALLLLQTLSGVVVTRCSKAWGFCSMLVLVHDSAGSRAGAVVVPVLVEGLPCPALSLPCHSQCSS